MTASGLSVLRLGCQKEAGLSKRGIDRVLKQSPCYLNWNVESKLLPVIHMWQQELGLDFASEVQRTRLMLAHTPQGRAEKHAWLASVGATSPRRAEQQNGLIFELSLETMQSKVAVLHSNGFIEAEVQSVIAAHPRILRAPSKRSQDILRVADELFCTGSTEGVRKLAAIVASSCENRLFSQAAAQVEQSMCHFRSQRGCNRNGDSLEA